MQRALPPEEGEADRGLLCRFCSSFGAFPPGEGGGSQPQLIDSGNSSVREGLEKEMETVEN